MKSYQCPVVSNEGECEFMSPFFLLKFWASGLFCGLNSLKNFKKKKSYEFKVNPILFVLTVAARLPFVPGPKPVVILFLNYFRVVEEVLQITWDKNEAFTESDKIEKH